ncbi:MULTISPECIES: monovalent cation:proton antiporter-2 (CPA2) family protein [unclassified Halomonas]|uniref:monovalent cation:proton antiporter-2 (CPA2) family protein n=1 Tax=unclassified Halomonas TaxID=2609666 RepID=UPI001C93C7BC|nr:MULTISPECIES: monovalent cation:proton antiporter-2 (CPA2) family protein [unclassified Halomonas]MBY5924835.1 monovalent cation:proton antiporter-2 (CPA2) family protein [Halomonas sp. DP4Y7-2]MBY6231877.1 monovalent cation:proton antiporter-2 (CPA2) family protein [Halomonas sp. DP4Y7-1]
MATALLFNVLIFLAAAVVVVPVIKRLGLGEVLGYLIAGVLIGPSALGLVPDAEGVLQFSQVGIVFLLFVIGLELKPARLKLMRKPVFGFGSLQVAITTLVLGVTALALGLSPVAAAVVGFSLGLCSTPLVLHLLGERQELNSRHGRNAFSLLLFQDMAAIPVLAVIPILGADSLAAGGVMSALKEVAIAVAAFAGLIFGGRKLLPPLFRRAAATESREVFAGMSLLVLIGAALLMELAGLSMALGAFIAGILLADSEYRHSIEADIEPFRGLLLGLFFMAVGMTAQIGLLAETPGLVLGLTALLLVAKGASLMLAARAYGCGWRETTTLGVLLSQGGEFAFVVLTAAGSAALLETSLVSLLVLVVSLSMATTPVLFLGYERWIRPLFKKPRPKRQFDAMDDDSPRIILAGFGRFGQVMGRALQGLEIPYTILDINADHVDFVRRYGNKVYFGDATRLDLLEAAGARQAQVLVVAVGDPEISMRIIQRASKRFPHLKIYARARDRQHAQRLMRAKVDYVLRELLPASLEMTREVLVGLGIPRDKAQQTIDTFRPHDEDTLRRQLEVFGNEKKQMQTIRQAAKELETLYEADEDILRRVDEIPSRASTEPPASHPPER